MNEYSYNEWASMSDKALIDTIGKFIQYHRLNQNRSQAEVAKEAGMSRSTLSLLERGEKTTLISLIRVLRVLDLLYVMDVFKFREEISPVEYAKLQKHKRQRARKTNSKVNSNKEPGW